MPGEFQKLLPFAWRNKQYPITDIEMTLAHDLVLHKYYAVDGARVEDTGVAPLHIRATIPISNHIYPGPQERWNAEELYPTALRQFIIDFGKKNYGPLQHPEFGELTCKPESMTFRYSGDRQSATAIQASWIETIEEGATALVIAPGAASGVHVSDLNISGDDLRKLAPTLPTIEEDLASIGSKVSALFDAAFVASYRAAGVANEIIYQAQRIQQSIDRLKSAETWPITRALQSAMSVAYDVRQEVLTSSGIGLYVLPADSTLAAVATALPNSPDMGEVIQMNPNLVRSPLIEKGTRVRYPIAA